MRRVDVVKEEYRDSPIDDRDADVQIFRSLKTLAQMTAIVVVSFINVLVQDGLLTLSLSALATSQNVTPPWMAIVMAVAGMLLLL